MGGLYRAKDPERGSDENWQSFLGRTLCPGLVSRPWSKNAAAGNTCVSRLELGQNYDGISYKGLGLSGPWTCRGGQAILPTIRSGRIWASSPSHGGDWKTQHVHWHKRLHDSCQSRRLMAAVPSCSLISSCGRM